MRITCLAACLFTVALTSTPHAAGPTVEIYTGSILGSSRTIGLAGAYTGIAEGIEGFFSNPAAPANRPRHSRNWFTVDFNVDWVLKANSAIDFDNDGQVVPSAADFTSWNVSLGVNIAQFAMGMHAQANTYSLLLSSGRTELSTVEAYFGAAYAFRHGEWVVGAGYGQAGLTAKGGVPGDDTVIQQARYGGTTLTAGVLWRPAMKPWRLGLSMVLATRAKLQEGPSEFSDFEAPSAATLPWRLSVGFSRMWSFGGFAYNHAIPGTLGWCSKEEPFGRRYVLVSAELMLVGANSGAVNLEGFVSGMPQNISAYPSVVARLGVESEFLANRLKGRLGLYNEPSRTNPGLDAAVGRVHATGSLEVRVFSIAGQGIKLSAGFDVARRYQNILISAGFWH